MVAIGAIMINVTAILLGVIIGILFVVFIAITLWSVFVVSSGSAPDETPLDNERRFK